MTDHCFHEEDWGAMKATVDHLAREIDGNGSPGLSKTVPVLNKSVNDLGETIGELRTAVSGLAKFTESMKGAEQQKGKSFANTFKVAGFIVAFLGLLISFIVMSRDTKESVRDMIDQYGYDMKTRGFENDTINGTIQ